MKIVPYFFKNVNLKYFKKCGKIILKEISIAFQLDIRDRRNFKPQIKQAAVIRNQSEVRRRPAAVILLKRVSAARRERSGTYEEKA